MRHSLLATSALALLTAATDVRAQTAPSQATQAQNAPATAPPAPGAVTLPPVTVSATPAAPTLEMNLPVSPQIQRYAPPATTESVSSQQAGETINVIDTEDAVKYLPSIFLRKRNNGDNQATLETRTWGVNSSARSLVYADDVLISALIANNNTIGAPRWGMVPPEEIKGIDFLYGPFSAAYPGNSEGGVMLITTQMPDQLTATAKQTESFQTFDMYKTHNTYPTSESSATMGDKVGRLTFFLSADHEDSFSQPLYFVTNGTIPAGTSGAIPALSKTGTPANVVGAGGLQRSLMNTLTGKVAVDLTDWLRATYTVGYWDNDTHAEADTYLTDSHGNPTFAGVSGFASDTYIWQERHLMNALSIRSDTHGDWDFDAAFTRYDYLQDLLSNPAATPASGTTFAPKGLIANMGGTGWSTQDVKGIWRPTGPDGAHEVSFGFHRDEYVLEDPTYNAPDWQVLTPNGNGTLYSDSAGKTETYALWLQDAWKFYPGFKVTLGGRIEQWQAFDGYNLLNGVGVSQPTIHAQDFSPKASLAWQFAPLWTATTSFGQASRFPTVSELYQEVAAGPIEYIPNPNLSPERDTDYEIAIERKTVDTRVRLSLFEENTRDALIQQTNFVNNAYVTTWQNVGATRNRGFELVTEERDWLIPGLELSNSVTYVNSLIVSDPSFASAAGTTATGKRVPYVPDWRDTLQATYRPTDQLAMTLAARYSGKMYSTLDNTDTVNHVMGSFDSFFVVDTHVHYQVSNYLTADAGIDNLFNETYFEYHPFPGRTYIASLKLKF
ncbi:MAG TPA: TonB-dependent receptor [Rhodopila sp.]|jgi:iron complex outermembrane receptor protein|nr:TonB-dependent receptor [Rhodopila sp.]